MISVVRQHSMRRLERALDRAVASAPALAAARLHVLRAPRLLGAAGVDAPDALRGDRSAMNRLHAMLSVAATSIFRLAESLRDAEGGEDEDGRAVIRHALHSGLAALPMASTDDPRCGPGLLRMGDLVVVGLAAGRVGARVGAPQLFVELVQLLAVASLPAEAVSRALEEGMKQKQLNALLGSLIDPSADDPFGIQKSFLFDDCMRARWNCIQRVFDEVRAHVEGAQWAGAITFPITSIDSDGPGKLKLALRSGYNDLPEAQRLGLTVESLHRALKKEVPGDPESGTAEILFASRHGETSRKPTSANKNDPSARVEIPPDARAGWLAIVLPATRESMKKTFSELRSGWEGNNKKMPCLADAAVPLDALPKPDEVGLAPPFDPDARWGIRIVDAFAAQPGPTFLPEVETTVHVKIQPHTPGAMVRLQIGDTTLEHPVTDGRVEITLDASLVQHGAAPVAEVFGPEEPRPDDERDVRLEFDDVAADEDEDDDEDEAEEEEEGPVVPGPAQNDPIQLTVIRFALKGKDGIIRVDAAEVAKATGDAEGTTRTSLPQVPPPLVLDADLHVDGFPRDASEPLVQALIERLCDMAARTPGLEDSLWIGVVPRTQGHPGFAVTMPADAARMVAICTANKLSAVVEAAGPPVAAAIPRMRLVGSLGLGDISITEPLRTDERKSGHGGAYTSQFIAALHGSKGELLTTHRLATANPVRLGRFAALVPVGDFDGAAAALRFRVDPNLFAVELDAEPKIVVTSAVAATAARIPRFFEIGSRAPHRRSGQLALPHFDRPGGDPTVTLLEPIASGKDQPATMEWRYTHSASIHPHFEAELGQPLPDGTVAWTRFAQPRSSTSTTALPAGVEPVPAGATAASTHFVRIVATDGWNTTTSVKPVVFNSRIVIRHAGGGSFWADVADDLEGQELQWRIGNRTPELVRTDRLHAVSSADIGRWMTVESGRGETARILVPDWGRMR